MASSGIPGIVDAQASHASLNSASSAGRRTKVRALARVGREVEEVLVPVHAQVLPVARAAAPAAGGGASARRARARGCRRIAEHGRRSGRRADSPACGARRRRRATWRPSPSSPRPARCAAGAMRAGQRASSGTRIPPSSRSIFLPTNGHLSEKRSAPLSLVNTTSVSRARPAAPSASRMRPMPSSMWWIIGGRSRPTRRPRGGSREPMRLDSPSSARVSHGQCGAV